MMETNRMSVAPAFLEEGDRLDRGPARGEHRIEDVNPRFAYRGGKFAKVFDRFVARFVAPQADLPHLGGGDEGQKPLHHPEAGPKDGDETQPVGIYGGFPRFLDGGHDVDFVKREVVKGLVSLHDRDFLHEFAEENGSGVLASKQGDLVLEKRMVEEDEVLALADIHGRSPFFAFDSNTFVS
jgi:hypothetical protein